MTTTSLPREGGLTGTLRQSPAVGRLQEAAKGYATAQAGRVLDGVGDRVGRLTQNLEKVAESGDLSFAGEAGKRVLAGASPLKAGLAGAGSKLKDRLASLFGGGRGGGGKPKMANIIESIDIGAPVQTVFDQWTQYQDFPRFAKGVESVEQQDETTTTWRAKVGMSRRTWKGKVLEQEPDRRIVWSSEGSKGSTKGVVTFHPLADDLTRVLLDVEYYPNGVVEKVGNVWRVAGRRVRLDLKHFRRFVMMENKATGSWRGRIRDGEVVAGPEEEEEAPEEAAAEQPEGEEAPEEQAAEAEEGEEEPEEQVAEEEEYEEEPEEEEAEGGEEPEEQVAEEEEYEEEPEEEEAEAEEEPEPAPRAEAPGRGRPRRETGRRRTPVGSP
jgi:uncharacterized membrane protein